MLESKYQAGLIKRLHKRFPGCLVLKNDPDYLQGIPDLSILWRNTWAALEVKSHADAVHQPNQDFYIQLLDGMSYAAFIYPENEKAVLDELEQKFQSHWQARFS